MEEYKLELKQIVDYPRCRMYRQFVLGIMNNKNLRIGGESHLYYYTVLCCYANFRTSYHRVKSVTYTLYPGEWICKIEEIMKWFRVRNKRQVIIILEKLQEKHLLKFKIVGQGDVIMRHLLYDFTNIRKTEYLSSAADSQGIIIREYSDMIEIELPCLFPHRKQRMSSEYITDPLYFLLSRYTELHPVKKYTDCVVCFVHEYDMELPNRRIRDYDNMEQKQVLDVIAAFVLTDDGGMCCDSYNTVALGDADKTRIFIMPRERFCAWLAEQNMG